MTTSSLSLKDASKASSSASTHAPASVDNTAKVSITLNINDKDYHIEDLDPRTTILDVCRHNLGITGPKKGCDHGQCGACTMLINGERINSCLTLAIMHDGDKIVTIEGLGTPDNLSELQQAFVEFDAFQCGYCTPGQICSATALIEEVKKNWPSHVTTDLKEPNPLLVKEIAERMSGNVCRCSAYPNIIKAIALVLNKEIDKQTLAQNNNHLVDDEITLDALAKHAGVTGIWSPPNSETQIGSNKSVQQVVEEAKKAPDQNMSKETLSSNGSSSSTSIPAQGAHS